MRFEEFRLRFQSILHTFLCIDILLTPVDYTNETQLQGVNSAGQDIQRIGTRVHEV